MMEKFFITVGQVAVGAIVGVVAGDGVNKLVVEPIKKVIKAKKEEA